MTAPPITPLPVTGTPGFVMLFGGTFDPPHKGHVELPVKVRDEVERREECPGRGWLVYVPAARSPHKPGGPMAGNEDRAEMLRRCAAAIPRAGVWTDEIDRADAEPSYTVETLGRAREWMDEHGMSGSPLRLLIGADQAMAFHKWRQPRDILRIARPVVMIRGDARSARSLAEKMSRLRYWSRDEIGEWLAAVAPVGAIDVSATRVREALRGGDAGAAAGLIPEPVRRYIVEHQLYPPPTH